jgi:hypothetical protein
MYRLSTCRASAVAYVVADTHRRSWNMQQAAKHGAALSLQSQQLEKLQTSVESGNLALIGHITTLTSQGVIPSKTPVQCALSGHEIPPKCSVRKRAKQGADYTFRLRLPRRLVNCVWEFGLYERDCVWTLQLKPINIRPASTYVFDFVRAGDVGAVRRLLESGQMSIHDRQTFKNGSRSLLEVSEIHYHSRLRAVLLTVNRWQRVTATLSFADFCCRRPRIFMITQS